MTVITIGVVMLVTAGALLVVGATRPPSPRNKYRRASRALTRVHHRVSGDNRD